MPTKMPMMNRSFAVSASCIDMAYIVMAYIGMAHIVMAYIVMGDDEEELRRLCLLSIDTKN